MSNKQNYQTARAGANSGRAYKFNVNGANVSIDSVRFDGNAYIDANFNYGKFNPYKTLEEFKKKLRHKTQNIFTHKNNATYKKTNKFSFDNKNNSVNKFTFRPKKVEKDANFAFLDAKVQERYKFLSKNHKIKNEPIGKIEMVNCGVLSLEHVLNMTIRNAKREEVVVNGPTTIREKMSDKIKRFLSKSKRLAEKIEIQKPITTYRTALSKEEKKFMKERIEHTIDELYQSQFDIIKQEELFAKHISPMLEVENNKLEQIYKKANNILNQYIEYSNKVFEKGYDEPNEKLLRPYQILTKNLDTLNQMADTKNMKIESIKNTHQSEKDILEDNKKSQIRNQEFLKELIKDVSKKCDNEYLKEEMINEIDRLNAKENFLNLDDNFKAYPQNILNARKQLLSTLSKIDNRAILDNKIYQNPMLNNNDIERNAPELIR